MVEKEIDNKNEQRLKSAQINRALGLFTLFFGIVIIIAIFFTETTIGQITNLVAGSIMVAIGGGMAWKSKTAKN